MNVGYFLLAIIFFVIGATISAVAPVTTYQPLAKQISLKSVDGVKLQWSIDTHTYCVGDCTNNNPDSGGGTSWGGSGGGK